MEKKIASFLFSTRLMAVLFIGFAAAMAAGTFIEDAYNTDTARVIIYNAWWFESIMVFFAINFIGNIKRYQLHKKENWATLLLHLSFILIILGAFVTRYISYEGMMPIREGETQQSQISFSKTKRIIMQICIFFAHKLRICKRAAFGKYANTQLWRTKSMQMCCCV